MKQYHWFLILTLTVLVLCSGSVLAYHDISDAKENAAAEAMVSLGFMTEENEDTFSENQIMRRAEFTRMVVKMLGFNDMLVYNTFTIFPDVKSTLAEAPYINAAVRKYNIIRGFPDGSFRPNAEITYSQAVTILLNVLGYGVSEIGPFWPENYLDKAEQIALTAGITLAANDSLSRSKAALLAWNLLNTKTKAGTDFLYSIYSNITENALLLRTWQTSSELSKGRAEFSVNGSVVEYFMQSDLPLSFLGSKGRLIFDRDSSANVIGFLPSQRNFSEATVLNAYADRLVLSNATYKIPRATAVFVDGQLTTYSAGWYNLLPEQTVRLYYDDYGSIDLISATTSKAIAYSFIYGINSDERIPLNAKVIKNGVEISSLGVYPYDVVSFDGQTGIYYVSDARFKGYYQSGSPIYNYPETITVFGHDFLINEAAAETFAVLRLHQQIVLLFDVNNKVAGAFPVNEVNCQMTGILKSISPAGNAVVELQNGISVSGIANLSSFGSAYTISRGYVNELLLSHGQLVTVTQQANNEYLSIQPVNYSNKTIGDWNLSEKTIGASKVAANVKIYEQVSADAPLILVNLSDIPSNMVENAQIRHTISNSVGAVSTIILADVTGKGWQYGMLKYSAIIETLYDDSGNVYEANTGYRVWLQQMNGDLTYTVPRFTDRSTLDPMKVPTGMDSYSSFKSFQMTALEKYATVSNKNFDGSKGLHMGSAYLKFSETMQIYAADLKQFISMTAARANNTSFVAYLDRPLEDGGQVVFLIAK